LVVWHDTGVDEVTYGDTEPHCTLLLGDYEQRGSKQIPRMRFESPEQRANAIRVHYGALHDREEDERDPSNQYDQPCPAADTKITAADESEPSLQA
jgi:hypothetical protein